MASEGLLERLHKAAEELNIVLYTTESQSSLASIDAATVQVSLEAKRLAEKWLANVRPVESSIPDNELRPLLAFTETIVNAFMRRNLKPDQTIRSAVQQAQSDFLPHLPVLIYELLEVTKIASLTTEDFFQKRTAAIEDLAEVTENANNQLWTNAAEASNIFKTAVEEAQVTIRKTAEEAAEDLELAKANARHISVDSAQRQFNGRL